MPAAAFRSDPSSALRLNRALVAPLLGANLFVLIAVPAWLLPISRWWGLLLAPVAFASNTLWSIIHEAIHGHLFPRRPTNDRTGRALCVLYGAPFRPLRVGHLIHHRYSRTERERTEVYDPARTSHVAAAARFYVQLLGGVYLIEALGSLLCLLPRRMLDGIQRRVDRTDSTGGILIRAVCQPAALRETRIDLLAIIVIFGMAAWLYGPNVWMLVAFVLARAALVSIADNAYHYGTRLDHPRAAMNAAAPRWVACALLHFNLHGVHHGQPHLPWFALRAQFAHAGAAPDIGIGACLLRQFRGPIPLGRFAG